MLPSTSGWSSSSDVMTLTTPFGLIQIFGPEWVVEPTFDADFRPSSYGLRTKRRAHDAIAEIHYLTSLVTPRWVGSPRRVSPAVDQRTPTTLNAGGPLTGVLSDA